MNKKSFYKEQAEKFRGFADKNPGRELLSLFEEWVESKDFTDEDKKGIFKEIVRLPPKNKHILVTNVKVHLKNDPELLKDIIKVILHALKLAEEEENKN